MSQEVIFEEVGDQTPVLLGGGILAIAASGDLWRGVVFSEIDSQLGTALGRHELIDDVEVIQTQESRTQTGERVAFAYSPSAELLYRLTLGNAGESTSLVPELVDTPEADAVEGEWLTIGLAGAMQGPTNDWTLYFWQLQNGDFRLASLGSDGSVSRVQGVDKYLALTFVHGDDDEVWGLSLDIDTQEAAQFALGDYGIRFRKIRGGETRPRVRQTDLDAVSLADGKTLTAFYEHSEGSSQVEVVVAWSCGPSWETRTVYRQDLGRQWSQSGTVEFLGDGPKLAALPGQEEVFLVFRDVSSGALLVGTLAASTLGC